MAKAIIETPGKVSKIMWQDNGDGIGAPALLLEGYSDIIQVQQGENFIQLNYETLEGFIKQLQLLKAAKK